MSYDAGIEITENALALHRNENLFIDPQWLREIAREVVSRVNFHQYPDSLSRQLRKKLAEIYAIDPDWIYIGNGADGVLADLFQHLRGQYDEVGTHKICYTVYPYLFHRYQYRHVYLENHSPSLCVIDSPNSITGEVRSLSNYSNAFLIWDNVYGEFSKDEIKSGGAQVVIRSFSKFYGVASLRVGYCFAEPPLIAELDKKKDVFNVNGMAQALALQLLENKPHFDALLPQIQEARIALQKGLKRLGFEVADSRANFVWITHSEISMKRLQEALLTNRIVVRHYATPTLDRHLRITVPPLEQIHPLLEIIGAYV